MDYSKLLQTVLDIAEEMLVAGAEVNRVEDSIERMISAYDCPFERVNVFIITTNIQTTFEDPDGNIITQIRRIKRSDTNFDRLDYLNDLSRYICEHKPGLEEMRSRYLEVMNRPQHSLVVKYLSAALVSGTFTVFFGGSFFDGFCAFVIGAIIVFLQRYLRKFNENQLALTFTTAFISGMITIILFSGGLANMNYILIGQIMLLIPGLALTNSVRDMLLGDIATGSV
ncbi:MAG: threonine/serine exporter family protein, partial [Firmicutes bacterium]|nr:threonine/serine exporter family protein [Bacillota bacterium]